MAETLELRIVDPYSPEAAALIAAISTQLAMRYEFSDDGSGQFKPADDAGFLKSQSLARRRVTLCI